ncbi:alpha/beta hydrolase [Palleronia sp.]|uniref:alpha/beta hydrolase n=1 Tax=Palleronia sp. TaxID=1940284 RepID=UPI0035C860E8
MNVRGLILAIVLPVAAVAQPVQTPLGPTILETGSDLFAVDAFTIAGAGQGADYEIGVLTPRRTPPADGFAALFLLDGQAALEVLTPDFLATLDPDALPVVVSVGYDTDRRFASEERARDYTPPDAGGAPLADPRGRPGGQAPAFLDLLTSEVVPRVEGLAPIDADDLTLWGHSYGGLFVLYAAGTPSAPFAHFVAASPSLWWNDGRYFDRTVGRMSAGDWPDQPLDLHRGEMERARASTPGNPNAQKLARMRAALREDAFGTLAATARAAGIPGETTIFPGLSHGETFRASIRHLLKEAN